MRKHLCLLALCLSTTAFAQTAEKCLEEAVELSISYKISKMADGNCSNLGIEEFKEIEETRNNKKRFMTNAIRGLNAGEKIPASMFSSLEDSSSPLMLDKTTLCTSVTPKSNEGAKEMMKDCPGGAELYQYLLVNQKANEKISEVPLSTACHKVDEMKARACRESKTVTRTFASEDKEVSPVTKMNTSPTNGSASARNQ